MWMDLCFLVFIITNNLAPLNFRIHNVLHIATNNIDYRVYISHDFNKYINFMHFFTRAVVTVVYKKTYI